MSNVVTWGTVLSCIPSLPMDANSKDILVIKGEINDLDIRITVHHSDTISVVIGCSYSPVAVDIPGVIRLSNALTLIHDRLQRMVNDNCDANYGPLVIPNYRTWTVTVWHSTVRRECLTCLLQ